MKRSVVALIGAAAAVAAVLAGVGLVGVPSVGQAASTDVDSRFVGNWDLVSFVSFRESGESVDNNYIARIMYDEHGNMMAVGMPRDLHERPRNADGSQPRTGFAYFATVEPHLDEGYVIHRVAASPMNPSWVGSEQVRFFEFDEGDDILRLSLREGDSPSGRTTGTLTWRRIEE